MLKGLMLLSPVLTFFIFNTLTPYWWDDFPNACFTVSWSEPRIRLISSVQDMIQSTYNLYMHPVLAGNGRVFTNFLQFAFCASRNKLIFDVCNTIIYALFMFLVCYHGVGSVRKVSAPLYLMVNIIVWLLTPSWGQDFLWLTGSLNYLWTLTFALLFLIPYKLKFSDASYRLKGVLLIPFLFAGIILGWCMQNLSAGLCVVLTAYFIRKYTKKEKISLFEVFGALGVLIGFYFLIISSNTKFPGIKTLSLRFIGVTISFLRYCILPAGLSVLLGIEIFIFRKKPVNMIIYGYFAIAFVSFYSLVLGYVTERAVITPVVFFIISTLNCLKYFDQTPKRYFVFVCALVFFTFIPSFYRGSQSIVASYLLSKSRERYIITQKNAGVSDIVVKTPIPVEDSHSGLYGGIDILIDKEAYEYKVHNIAKSLFYEVDSLTGTTAGQTTGLKISLGEFLKEIRNKNTTVDNLFAIIYKNWQAQ